jgi:hypothetical protein
MEFTGKVLLCGTQGNVVAKVLRCKPEGTSARTRPSDILSLWQKWVPEREKYYFWAVKRRPARRAEILTAIYEPIL